MAGETNASTDAPHVRFIGVQKTYDGASLIVRDLNLDIRRGEFLTLLGPSGSGKTTTLMMLAGFETPTSGEILLGGQVINRVPPHRRNIGMVFQNYALFPHMTVADNLRFPLRVRKLSVDEIEARVRRALAMIRLEEYAKRYPQQLSGGQQQRVAIARALAMRPKVMLFDEPTSALDPELVGEVLRVMRSLADEGRTMLVVTHEMGFARHVSNRVMFLHEGRVELDGSPQEVFGEQKSERFRQFVSSHQDRAAH